MCILNAFFSRKRKNNNENIACECKTETVCVRVYYITNVTCIIIRFIVTNRVRFISRVSHRRDSPFAVYIVCEPVEEDGFRLQSHRPRRGAGARTIFYFWCQNVKFFRVHYYSCLRNYNLPISLVHHL